MHATSTALPPWYLAELLGLENGKKEIEFAGQVVAALEKVSGDLVPRVLAHPLIHEIAAGRAALERLVARVEDDTEDRQGDRARAIALDAIAEIAAEHGVTLEVVSAVERALATAKSPEVASTAARALACAGVESFLELQRSLLGSSRPDEVRMAAKLLGFGRYARAVPVLLEVLRPDQVVAADAIIWALGEIGSLEAVIKLHAILRELVLVEEVLEALGKIGSRASVASIMPLVAGGTARQRERAVEALARIIRKNDGSLGDPELERAVRAVLEGVIDRDESKIARFHAVVGFSLLGGRLEPARILRALGASLTKRDLAAVGGLLKAQPRAEATAKPKRGRGPSV